MAEWGLLGKSKGKGGIENAMGGGGSVRVEEVLVVRKTGNYVTYTSACSHAIDQSTSRSGQVAEGRPQKGNEAKPGRSARFPGHFWTRTTACSTQGDEGDLSEALHVRGKSCKYYPIV